MHRSGTSFLARSLNLGGVDLGALESMTSNELFPLNDNKKGHWENKEILNLTEETFSENDCSWHNIASKIIISKKLGKKINNTIQKLNNSYLITGIKDPRLVICFEAWKNYLPENIIFVGIFRHPLSVAESLKKRNDFSYEKSIELWRIYNEKLLQLIKQNNGFLLNFDWPKKKIFSEIKTILKKLNLDEKIDLEDWYSSELFHSDKTVNKDFKLTKNILKLYDDLQKQTIQNSKVTLGFSSSTTPNMTHGFLIQNQKQFSYFRDNFNILRSQLSKLENQLDDKNQKITSLQNDFDEKTTWANELNTKIKDKDTKIVSLQQEFDEKTSWANELEENSKSEQSKTQQLQEEIKSEQSKTQQLQEEIKSEQSKTQQLQEEIKSEQSKTQQLQEEIKKAHHTIEDSKNIIATKDKQLEEASTRYYQKSYELDQIKRSIMFGVSSKVARFLNKLFPPSTKRGNFLKMVRLGFLIYKNEGWSSLKISASEKFKQSKLAKPKNNSHDFISQKSIKLHKENLFEQIQNTSYSNSLRNNIKFNSHKITNLTNYPKISIIIPTYDQVHLLRQNLDSIKSKTTYQNYEIIIVTNNMDKNSEMRKFLNLTDHLVLIYEKEYSFSGINNFAASKASGDFLLFLNDDVEIITPSWLESLLSLGLKNGTGAVGAKILFPNGKLQEAGCIVWKRGNAWNYGRNQDPDLPEFNFVREIDYCSGCCFFVKKDIFDKVGGFNIDYHPAYSEDVDLCFTLRQNGYSVLYQPLASIIHHEGMTQGTNTDKGIKSYQITNQQKFAHKWKNILQHHLEDSIENSFFERNKKNGLNILYIDHYNHEPDKDSGSLRTFNMLSTLSHMNNKITFWPDNRFKSEPYTTELQQKGIEVIYGPNDFKSFLDSRKKFYDVVIMARPYIASKYIDIIKNHDDSCKIIYDTTDLHFLRMRRQQTFDKNLSDSEINKMHNLELTLMRKSDVTILTSEIEQKILKKEDPSINIAIIPNVHTIEIDIPEFENRKDLMFLGGFQHLPNIDAVKYLASEIFPKIQKELFGIKLYIVGSNPPKEIIDLQTENFLITGYQKDISSYFKQCRLMLSPLRFGAGVKGKITQSLAYGLPVVTSSIGSEGIKLVDGENCMISDNVDDFVKKTVSLYHDKENWKKFSKNGLKIAELYSPETTQLILKKILTKF